MRWIPRNIFYGVLVLTLLCLLVPVGRVCGKGPRPNSRTRAQFTNYMSALDSFHQEYGKYPAMFDQRESINLADFPNVERFVIALSGRELNGQRAIERARSLGNRKCIGFYTFGEDEWSEPNEFGSRTLVDGYGNPNIVIHVDHDGDGFVTVPINGVPTRVEARIYIYSIAEDEKESVMVPNFR